MRHLETFSTFRDYIFHIQPENTPEEHIRIAFLNYLGSDEDDTQWWATVSDLISNLVDECHDGAFLPEQDQFPFTEDELEDFLIKYDIHG